MRSIFDPAGLARLEPCLGLVLRTFDAACIALTGGIAVEYHLAAAGKAALRHHIADIDFVVRPELLPPPAIPSTLLVSHFHAPRSGVPNALLQLVDPRAALRIDIFPDREDAPSRAQRATLGTTSLRILDARSILAHKIRTLGKASPASPADPKHWRDARALAEITGEDLPAVPQHVAPSVLCTDVDARCTRCELSRDSRFPLAPKRDIFALLGYV